MDKEVRKALVSFARPEIFLESTRELSRFGVEIWASSGTARYLSAQGIDVNDVSELTGFSNLLGGRVKTLHPKVFAGILADPQNLSHQKDLQEQGGIFFDVVAVDLYPFESGVEEGLKDDLLKELIDIGGVALIRAAAKNAPHTCSLVDKEGFSMLLAELKANRGRVSSEMAFSLAVRAFSHTSAYDALIAKTMLKRTKKEEFPEVHTEVFKLERGLRYGENPHQGASLYLPKVSKVLKLDPFQGKELSYNNILDSEAAFLLAREFEEPTVAIIKHANPCGVAQAGSIAEAFERALACDPESAFGGIVACNRLVDEDLAQRLRKIFLEVILAPAYSEEAKGILAAKKNTRVCTLDFQTSLIGERTSKETIFGLLVQDRDSVRPSTGPLEIASRLKPTPEQLRDLRFAIDVAKHVRSNAIVFVKNTASVGIGAGQMSRVDAVKLAALKSKENARGAVMGSDAFFPFPDGVECAHEAGIEAFIAPKGSVRDQEVLEAADRMGMVCVFVPTRHFRH